jgi:DNA-binding transcriptional ArsR family regulator
MKRRKINSDGPEMTIRTLRESVDGLKAMAHPVRLRILALLRGGELCVCQVTEVLELAPSTISEHLSLLRRAGVITERKEGKWVFYALAKAAALGPLCEALWPLVAGEVLLEADARRCAMVRKLPLSSICKRASGDLDCNSRMVLATRLLKAHDERD